MGTVPLRWEPSWPNPPHLPPMGNGHSGPGDCGQQRLEEEEDLFPDTPGRHSIAGGSSLLEEVWAGPCRVPPSGPGNPG